MQPTSNTYFLQVGEKGKERLAILNELFAETSQHLLIKAGLSKNSQVLEIGCGTGAMTTWIAETVGTAGHVFAVDSSLEQIEIARANVNKKNLHNVTFINQSIFDLQGLPTVDLIYSRFVLMHLTSPLKALQLLLSFLKIGGKIVCEEATNAVACCYPTSEIFQKHRQFLLKLSEQTNLDYNFGEKIYSYFKKLNLPIDYANFIQPVLYTKRQKSIITLLIHEVKHHYIKYNIATAEEIDALLNGLDRFINDDTYLVSFARTTQMIASKKNDQGKSSMKPL